jgi:ribose 5-phosphate isomerase B
MKKNKKDQSPENSEVKKRKTVRPAAEIQQGGENSSFPQEYEEQLSTGIRMKPQPLEAQEKTTDEQVRIGIAADHGGFKLKEFLVKMLSEANYEVIDFGDSELMKDDDYPDFVIPLADAIVNGTVERGIAICGSGVGVSIAANKVDGVRGSLITEKFSAHQGVEDDNMNMICLGGRVITDSLAGELVNIFLKAKFIGAERHNRRLAKVAAIENRNK